MVRKSLVENIRKRQREGLFPVISEIKLRSEKLGDLIRGRDPLKLVDEMAKSPVTGISVVTESRFFGGSMSLLEDVVARVSLPVLQKDFIREASQLEQSAKLGASAVLLIASLLDDNQLVKLIDAGKEIGIELLVEVHTASEMARVKDLSFDLLGINNRDITILEIDDTDVGLTESLAKYRPLDRPLISESSIKSPEDVLRAGRAGADGVLVGTAVMLADDPRTFLKSLVSVGWPL